MATLRLCALLLCAFQPAARAQEPLRVSASAFHEKVFIEVAGLPTDQVRTAAAAALQEIRELEHLTDPLAPPETGVARLNAVSGQGPQSVDSRLLELLSRALRLCFWSDGALGPLGGRLYRLWGVRSPISALPLRDDVETATQAARCQSLVLDTGAGTAELARDSRIDLWAFEAGFAVDRAVEKLKEHGAANGWVEIGWVRRAFGPGVQGNGWRFVPPIFAGNERPAGEVRLRDQAIAVASIEDRPLRVAGDTYAPFIDQRSGKPARGVLKVVTVTELAVDAQALAAAMFITGNREGRYRLAGLRPIPSVMWLLGSEGSQPLLDYFHWSDLKGK